MCINNFLSQVHIYSQFIPKGAEIKYLSERELNKIYDDFIYAITIRSIAEIFHFDTKEYVDTIMFNGRVISRNKATGKQEDSCILSVQVKRSGFEGIDLSFVDAKSCFKHFKGVGSSKLSSLTPITPIMELKRKDRRFVEPQRKYIIDIFFTKDRKILPIWKI